MTNIFSPELCNQICHELPLRLEQRLLERFSNGDDDTGLAVVESAHVLDFFDKIPFQTSYKFDRLIDRILNEFSPDDAAAYPFLAWYAKEHPFSPKLLGYTEPTVLIPNVYNQRYLHLRLIEGVCEYVIDSDPLSDGSFKSLVRALRFLIQLRSDSDSPVHEIEAYSFSIKLYMDFLVLILRFVDVIDLETSRFTIMKMLEDIISYFPGQIRVLILKGALISIVNKTSINMKHESEALAWLLSQFQVYIEDRVFVVELGNIFGLMESTLSGSVLDSINSYSSLLQLTRSFVNDCANTAMLVELRRRILVRIYHQLLGCLRFDVVKGVLKNSKPVCPNAHIQSACVPFNTDENSHLMSLFEDCVKTMDIIDKLLKLPNTDLMELKSDLLSLISDRKYEEALVYFGNIHNYGQECLCKLATEAISDVVTCFRDNNDNFLRSLVISLIKALYPEQLRFRICYDFVINQPTKHITEVFVSELKSMISSSFRNECPYEWNQLVDALPSKLGENLPDENDANVLRAASDVAHILYSFSNIPFRLPKRMNTIFTAAVNGAEPKMPEEFPLLLFHSKTHPFSPKLLGIEEPAVLIPNVYSLYYLGRMLVEGLTMYLHENKYNYEEHFMKPIVKALDVIVHALQGLNELDIGLCNDNLFLDNESAVVALFIDEYRRNLVEEQFEKELGSFLAMLENVRYENMCEASNYYMSIFTLVQAFALKRPNHAMLAEIKVRILDRIHDQMIDYIQLENIRAKEREDEKILQKGANIPLVLPIKNLLDGKVRDRIQLLQFGYDQAKQCILKALA
ncbi:hypothetical protein DICVIV_02011 [Dictyocaulus viviparus]|uniref:Uncharacterized protein n=1 Tax=Dictyocaulus viviparus TaxID=29172 RepID=A0A0D8Y530_DICVI|nr:hypothetical protein DICVIV_02011 [Dictyocaulus viviparus]